MLFRQLNDPASIAGSEAYRRVLARLGDDIEIIAAQLQLRPTAVARIDQGGPYILVRLTTPDEHVIVRIAPEDDLLAELFFCRTLEQRAIPSHRIILADSSRSRFPFAYLVEAFVGGPRASTLSEPFQVRAVARQLGRLCRQIHQLPTLGWGRPTPGKSWSDESWPGVVARLLNDGTLGPAGRLVFGEEVQERIVASLTTADEHAPDKPYLIHGAIGPERVVIAPGEQVMLVALLEPGPVIGGDPLYDLARALSPAWPEAFGEGFVNGYQVGALSELQQRRLLRLRLLDSYLSACRSYLRALPHEANATLCVRLLAELAAEA